jgi:hypothetical protein
MKEQRQNGDEVSIKVLDRGQVVSFTHSLPAHSEKETVSTQQIRECVGP